MPESQLNFKLKNIRAISDADIILDGITVVSGENGCGKSTISKLAYNLLKTSIDFDYIVDRKLDEELNVVYRTLDQLSKELSYFLEKNDYLKIRSSFKRLYHGESQTELFEFEDPTVAAIDYLITMFDDISDLKSKSMLSLRLERIKRVLGDFLHNEKNDEKTNVVELLKQLKSVVKETIEKTNRFKETRPISILEENLDEVFYDAPLAKTYNFYEYGVPIIDRTTKKLNTIHSIQNIVYIDTPMLLGIDSFASRTHWDDLNEVLIKKSSGKTISDIDSIFSNDIIKGDVKLDNSEISDKTFIYKRDDGQEFDLLECATGLKSFAILQILYKNGFFNDKPLLIIDEPEVHLHPQWVVEYARLIVLLNKTMGVKFLLASHHPDMISAIKYIAEKENSSLNLHFYLAEKDRNTYQYKYKDLGIEIDEIFSSFNIALERIDLYGKTE